MSLEKLKKDADKKFGKGTIQLGNQVESIPIICSTGSLQMDLAIGCGGTPEGRILEFYGPPSGGKCLVKNSYILTAEKGYKTIEEIFIENNINPSNTTKNVKKEYKLINRYGEIESTELFTCNGKKPIYEIKTKSGQIIKSTENHPHLIMNERGNLVWKYTGEIQEGDYLTCSRFSYFGEKKRNKDEMYALGCLIADGYFGKNRISITNDDERIKNFIEYKFCNIFGFKKYVKNENNDKGSFNYQFNDREKINKFYENYNYKPGIAKDKLISLYIRESDKESLKYFIKGYIDCESYIDREKGLEVCSASYLLLYQLKLIFSQFGIISSVHEKKVKNYEQNNYYRLNICGKEFIKYIEEIGTESNHRKNQINKFLENNISLKLKNTTNVDSIPNLNYILEDLFGAMETTRETHKLFDKIKGKDYLVNLTYERLNKILKIAPENHYITQYLKELKKLNYFFDEITSIKKVSEEPTFDFKMKETSSFIANGIITHNTSISLLMLAQVQKVGYNAAFIDVENSFDPDWASNLGVDLDKLIIAQPDSGDEVFELIEMMILSGDIKFIVIDSVSAMATKAEIEGDYGDAHISQLARLMSSGLKKLNTTMKGKDVTVSFINQIRMKIGGYGNPETTSGGNALKFYSSVRFEVRRREVIGDKEDPDGFVTKIKLAKNKCGPPFRKVEVNMYIGKNGKYGVDNDEEIIDVGMISGVIRKYKKDKETGELIEDEKGSWYKYKDVELYGRQKFIDEINSREDYLESLKKEVTVIFNKKNEPVEGSFADVTKKQKLKG